MEILTYLSSGEESERLYRDLIYRISRKSRAIRVRHAVFMYGYLLMSLAGLVGINVFAHAMATRLVMSFLLILTARKFHTSGAAELADYMILPTVQRVLSDYSRENAYEILQRARADTSRYGSLIVNVIRGQITMAAGGYMTVTTDVVFHCHDGQCGHSWGIIVKFPLYGRTRHIVYCPKCSALCQITLDGAQLPADIVLPPHMQRMASELASTEFLDADDASLPLLPLSAREPYAS